MEVIPSGLFTGEHDGYRRSLWVAVGIFARGVFWVVPTIVLKVERKFSFTKETVYQLLLELAAHPNGEYRQATRQTASGHMQEIILGSILIFSPKRLVEKQHFIGLIIHGQTLLGSWFFGAVKGYHVRIAASLLRDSELRLVELASVGSRLAYFGNLTFVSGASLMAA